MPSFMRKIISKMYRRLSVAMLDIIKILQMVIKIAITNYKNGKGLRIINTQALSI